MADLGKLLDDLYGTKLAGKKETKEAAKEDVGRQAGVEDEAKDQNKVEAEAEHRADPGQSLPNWARDDELDKAFAHWATPGLPDAAHNQAAGEPKHRREPVATSADDTAVMEMRVGDVTEQIGPAVQQVWRRGDDDILPKKRREGRGMLSMGGAGSSRETGSPTSGLLSRLGAIAKRS